MAAIAVGLGIYSYLILALGLVGWLYKESVLTITGVFLGIGIILGVRRIKEIRIKEKIKDIGGDRLTWLILGLLGIQVIVNFIGAISPELSFDALWYHLTPAKLYVQQHRIFYIPGWLLWPSNIPRLVDMFYTSALLVSSEILAKLIHFSFGILSTIALFNLLRRYFNVRVSLLGILMFYTMLIVGWQSTTAYVDLGRTFFEILALDYFLKWVEGEKITDLVDCAVLTGLAISTKILAFGTLGIFGVLILVRRGKDWPISLVKFIFIALLVVSPWLIQSFINTGNPLFPLFGNFNERLSPGITPNSSFFLSYLAKIFMLPWLFWKATIQPDDIISPVYLISLPLILLAIWKQKLSTKMAALYVLLGVFLAPAESNRYLLPYLPGFTFVTLAVFQLEDKAKLRLKRLVILVIVFASCLNVGSRVLATRKFLPYILGKESKDNFLSQNLNFGFGDFYDVDGWFANNIKSSDLVLVYGVHNLYYINFPFVHESWAKKGTYFTHILVGNNEPLPERFGKRPLLYQNPTTKVKVYLFGGRYE